MGKLELRFFMPVRNSFEGESNNCSSVVLQSDRGRYFPRLDVKLLSLTKLPLMMDWNEVVFAPIAFEE